MTLPAMDQPCPHETFDWITRVIRIVEPGERVPEAYVAEAQISCGTCGEQFRFTGINGGLSFDKPMLSPDHTELRAPIRPASTDPDFGLGLPSTPFPGVNR